MTAPKSEALTDSPVGARRESIKRLPSPSWSIGLVGPNAAFTAFRLTDGPFGLASHVGIGAYLEPPVVKWVPTLWSEVQPSVSITEPIVPLEYLGTHTGGNRFRRD